MKHLAGWNEIVVPIDAFRRQRPPHAVLPVGALVAGLHVRLPWLSEDVLIVDDVEVVRYGPR